MPQPSKPTILMVTGEYPPAVGGVGDYTRLLCRSLCQAGLGVHLLTTAGAEQEDDRSRPHVVRTVQDWGPGCLETVARQAVLVGAGVVHLQYQAAAYQLRGIINLLPFYLRLRLPSARVVTTFHDLLVPYLFPKAGRLRRTAVNLLDRFSDRSVVTNLADLEGLGGPAGGKRWLIRLGSNVLAVEDPHFDRTAWRASHLGANEDTLLLAYFGLLNRSKGVDLLVAALPAILRRAPSARLVIIGGEVGTTDATNIENARQLERLVGSLGLVDKVVRTGFVPPAEASAYLRSSDICVLPFLDGASLRRGSLLAALEHGKPVITTSPVRDEPLLKDGETVMMVPRDDVQAISDRVISLWEDRNAMEKLASGARGVAAHLTWPHIASSHVRLYKSLLEL